MHIGVIGINHRFGDINLREILAKAFQKHFSHAKIVHPHQSFILLSTCNRSELYFSSSDLASTHTTILAILRKEIPLEFEQKLYSFFHMDCFFHLAKVVSGLDSAILRETEIQGQVKDAYMIAKGLHALPKDLHFLFQKCLKIGKEIRAKIPLEPDILDLEHACFFKGKELFKNIEQTNVLFIGASRINVKILCFFQNKGIKNITLTNRTLANAYTIAEKFDVPHLLNWHNTVVWKEYDWIVLGTKAPHYLITKENFSSATLSKKLIIDLSLPRNVDPSIASENVCVINIDDLNTLLQEKRERASHLLEAAEKSVKELIHVQSILFKKKQKTKSPLPEPIPLKSCLKHT